MGVLKGRVCRATTAAYCQCEPNNISWYRYHLKRGAVHLALAVTVTPAKSADTDWTDDVSGVLRP
jgi:hypothetical protein